MQYTYHQVYKVFKMDEWVLCSSGHIYIPGIYTYRAYTIQCYSYSHNM